MNAVQLQVAYRPLHLSSRFPLLRLLFTRRQWLTVGSFDSWEDAVGYGYNVMGLNTEVMNNKHWVRIIEEN